MTEESLKQLLDRVTELEKKVKEHEERQGKEERLLVDVSMFMGRVSHDTIEMFKSQSDLIQKMFDYCNTISDSLKLLSKTLSKTK